MQVRFWTCIEYGTYTHSDLRPIPEHVRAAFDGETATSGDVIAMGLGSVRNRRGMRNGGLKASTPAWESVKLATTGEPGQEVLAMRCNRSPTSLWSSNTASLRASAQSSRGCCGRMPSTPWSCGARDERGHAVDGPLCGGCR